MKWGGANSQTSIPLERAKRRTTRILGKQTSIKNIVLQTPQSACIIHPIKMIGSERGFSIRSTTRKTYQAMRS